MTTQAILPANSTVGTLVAQHVEWSRVFERLGIDYCCGGKQTLAEACSARGLPFDEVCRELAACNAAQGVAVPGEQAWESRPLGELVDHILDAHHAYVREEAPRISQLLERVMLAHGRHHPQLAELERAFSSLRHELIWHMLKEENVLFPHIKRLEALAANPHFAPNTLPDVARHAIRTMVGEHERAGELLALMRRLTNEYRLPPEACATWRALWLSLERFTADLHLHVHEENNILFPRAAELEARLELAPAASSTRLPR